MRFIRQLFENRLLSECETVKALVRILPFWNVWNGFRGDFIFSMPSWSVVCLLRNILYMYGQIWYDELTHKWSFKKQTGCLSPLYLTSPDDLGWSRERWTACFPTDGCGSIKCEFYAVCESDGDKPKCVCPTRASCRRVSCCSFPHLTHTCTGTSTGIYIYIA